MIQYITIVLLSLTCVALVSTKSIKLHYKRYIRKKSLKEKQKIEQIVINYLKTLQK